MSEYKSTIDLKKKKGRVLIAVSIVVAFAAASLFYFFYEAAPKLKGESLNAKEISITWKEVRNAEIYNIYRMDDTNGEYKKISTVKESKFTDSNLIPKSSYWYKVAAVKKGEEKKLSDAVKVTTESLPNAPSQVSIQSVTFDKAVVKWNTVKDIKKYYIYRADGEKGKYNKVGESTSDTFNDSKLLPLTKYKYVVTSINKNGESEYSSPAETTTLEKINDRGNSGNNLGNRGLAAEQGQWIYFVTNSSTNSLYKMKKDGTVIKKLRDGYISSLNVKGDWIYFSDGYKPYKMKTDGSEYSEISKDVSGDFSVIGDWIYFGIHEGLIKMKVDGSEKVQLCSDNISQFNIEGDWIYYSNISDNNALYKIKTDGSNRARLTGETCGDINVAGDWIYYKNFNDNCKIYKIKNDGTDKSKVLDEKVNMFNVVGDNIYFENWGLDGRLFKVGLDGKNPVQLANNHYNCISVIGDYIFCYRFDYDWHKRNVLILKLKDDSVDLNSLVPRGF